MTATNHALTGALIGLTVANPLVAGIVAVASHFVCDVIPHYGVKGSDDQVKSKAFKTMLIVDALLCVLLVAVLALYQPTAWLLAAVCAFLATSPDLLWLRKFAMVNRSKPWRPNSLERFAANIQWFEKPSGAIVEVAWMAGAVIMLTLLLR